MQEWTDIRRKVLVDGATKRSVMIEYAVGYRTLEKILSYPEPPGYRQTGAREKTKIGRFTGVIEQILVADREAPPWAERARRRRAWTRLP